VRTPDGTEAGAHGKSMVIDRPRRLVMTCSFDEDPTNQQLMELTFFESAGSTTVLMGGSRGKFAVVGTGEVPRERPLAA
jgi:uncharacterized protein YndB with AHSA1/START domain